MLGVDPMKRSVVLGVFVLMASSRVASAGVYLGLGLGTDGFPATVHTLDTDGRALRLFGGFRFPSFTFGGNASIEGGVEGYDLFLRQSRATTYSGREWFAAGRFTYPFSSDFDAYARLGFQRTSLSGTGDLAGTGYLAGVGVDFRISTPVVSGTLFLDLTRTAQTLTFDDARSTMDDASVNRWMLGFTVEF